MQSLPKIENPTGSVVIEILSLRQKNLTTLFDRTIIFKLSLNFTLFQIIKMYNLGLCGLDAPITFYGPKMFAEFGFHIPYQYVVLMIPIGR